VARAIWRALRLASPEVGQARGRALSIARPTLIRQFHQFFEGDARHHLWIGSASGFSLAVYDQHNWIYAYGDLPAYIELLKSRGFVEGEINLPTPHAHYYNEHFDEVEDEVMDYWQWKYFPLQDQDE
jgi:hypothetical protein